MPYSKLVSVTKLTSHNSGYRTHKIDRITPHHTAGCGPVESVLAWFCNPKCDGSSNYIIGSDGRVALSVDEANRAWTSSSRANDDRAITIEVCNSASGGNWPVSNKAFDTLVLLCTDICQRYNKNKLLYFDKNTALSY